MSFYRRAVFFLLPLASLFLLSCAKRVSPSGVPVPPPITSEASAQYPNTAEGLRVLLNDMLAATRNGDRKGFDALIKQTEFPNYGRYFLRTYSPDPLAAEDWDVSYRNNVGKNEDLLWQLLEMLAKDQNGKIVVRKANDDPAPGKGLEWGMLHYARIPVDVYCATLVFSSSHDALVEYSGYYVYADGMFRWESLAPYSKPGTFQSGPMGKLNEGQTEGATSQRYSNTPDGLRAFLGELLTTARSGDQAQLDTLIKQTEIPDYRNWYCSIYVPGSALSWAIPYGNALAQNEISFDAFWEKLAQDDGEIRVRKLIDKPGGNRDMEWGMIHNSRTPLDIYHASYKSTKGAPDERIGYFLYIDGMFRWDSIVKEIRLVPRVSPAANH